MIQRCTSQGVAVVNFGSTVSGNCSYHVLLRGACLHQGKETRTRMMKIIMGKPETEGTGQRRQEIKFRHQPQGE